MTVVQANTVAGFGLVMRMAMTVLMAWIVVSAYKPSSTYEKWVAAVLGVCCFNLLLVFSGFETEAGLLNYFIGIVSPFIQIWGARTVREPMPGRWIFTAGWLLYFLIIVFGFPYNLGPQDWRDQYNFAQTSGDLRFNGIFIGSVFFGW